METKRRGDEQETQHVSGDSREQRQHIIYMKRRKPSEEKTFRIQLYTDKHLVL